MLDTLCVGAVAPEGKFGMVKFGICCSAIFLAVSTALAQESYPKFEVFGGYSFADTGLTYPLTGLTSTRNAAHGFGFSVTGNVENHVGVTTDVGFQFGTQKVLNYPPIIAVSPSPCGPPLGPCPYYTKENFNIQQFLFGPTVTTRQGPVSLFAHALFGATRSPGEVGGNSANFGMGFGGGLDTALSDRVAIRWFQVDYLPTHAPNQWTHDVRVEAGVVLRFGRR